MVGDEVQDAVLEAIRSGVGDEESIALATGLTSRQIDTACWGLLLSGCAHFKGGRWRAVPGALGFTIVP